MVYENLIYQKDNGIARVTINRPEVLNALNIAVLLEIKAAMEEAGRDDEVGLIVLTGAGRAFSAGVDLKSTGESRKERGNVAHDVINTIRAIPKVVIAVVNGYCLTGALEFVLGSCDLIIASKEAKFGDTHARWGLRPRWGMTQYLPHAVGMLKAKELSFTVDMITGQEAERIGLVNMAVPAEQLEETVQELAEKIMANSLDAVCAYKYLYNQGMEDTLRKGLELELESEFAIRDTEERTKKFSERS